MATTVVTKLSGKLSALTCARQPKQVEFAILLNSYTYYLRVYLLGKGKRFWPDESDADDVATSRAITTTAIMLCAYVAKPDIEEARPLARWLSNVRNTNLELPSAEVKNTIDINYITKYCLVFFI